MKMAVLTPNGVNNVEWKWAADSEYTVSDFGVFNDNYFYVVVLEGFGGKSSKFGDYRGHTLGMMMLNTGMTNLATATEVQEAGCEWIQLDGGNPSETSVSSDGFTLMNKLTSSIHMCCTNGQFVGWTLHLDSTGKWKSVKRNDKA